MNEIKNVLRGIKKLIVNLITLIVVSIYEGILRLKNGAISLVDKIFSLDLKKKLDKKAEEKYLKAFYKTHSDITESHMTLFEQGYYECRVYKNLFESEYIYSIFPDKVVYTILPFDSPIPNPEVLIEEETLEISREYFIERELTETRISEQWLEKALIEVRIEGDESFINQTVQEVLCKLKGYPKLRLERRVNVYLNGKLKND